MNENGNTDASTDIDARLLAIEEVLQNKAYVRDFMQDLARQQERDEASDHEPVAAFTVKLPVTDLAMLERIGSYLDLKKTPFASMLLQMAIQDAKYGLLAAFDERPGKREEVEAYLRELHQLEDGSGTVGPTRGRV